jgi:uncharacterized phage infection (PIP) family protein YhgE
MSALFHSYEQELNALLASLKARSTAADDRFGEDLREAESLVTQLEIEARVSSASQEVKSRISKLKEDIRHLRERNSLLPPGKSSEARHGNGEVNDRYLDDEEALDRSSQTLLNSRRTLEETESIAAGISQDLLSNRATILSSRDKLLHTGGLLGKAHRTMRSMQSRDVQRKICVYGAVGFVLLMFLAFAIRILIPSSPAPPPTGAPTLSPTPPPTAVPSQ